MNLLWILLVFSHGMIITLAFNDYDSRLSRSVQPEHYDLRILTQLENPDKLRFEGEVNIRLRVFESTNNITLHALNLTIAEHRIELRNRNSHNNLTNCVARTEINDEFEFYILHLCKTLHRDDTYELHIPFEGALNANNSGYYKSSYLEPTTNQTHWIAITQFSPTFARLAFPCFDEPDMKSTFTITLGYNEKKYKGISNTPIRKCIPNSDLMDYVWCEHEKLFSTSTYLVGYSVHDLSNAKTTIKDRVIFQNWIRKDVVSGGNFSSHLAPRILNYFEQIFNMKFPLRKVDQIAVPDHRFSAMENWGMVTFKEDIFLYDLGKTTQLQKEKTASIMAHEYAHQWFGNLVTMKWWNDLWLKEGFSTYFGYLCIDGLLPEFDGFLLRSTRNDLQTVFYRDASRETRAISRIVKNSTDILDNFSPYVYEKGALIVRMLCKILGNELFFKGLHEYLNKYAYSNANENDLWHSFETITKYPIDLSKAMSSWTNEKGYPLVTIERNYSNRSAIVKQSRFLLDKHTDERFKESEDCWWVPISYVTQNQSDFDNTQPVIWLECPQIRVLKANLFNLPNDDEWIILNPQVNTLYRVNYDEHNWHLIIKTLLDDNNRNRIHILNREQLIDDILMLAWDGSVSYKLAFQLIIYLRQEISYSPWKVADDHLRKIEFLLSGTSAENLKIFMRKLFEPFYKRYFSSADLQTVITQPALTSHRFAYTVACHYDIDNCVIKLLKMFSDGQLSGDIATVIPVDFQDIVYNTIIERGNRNDYEFLLKYFKNSLQKNQQRQLATAFGFTRDFEILEDFLQLTFNSSEENIRRCSSLAMASALNNIHIGIEARNYFLSHSDIIKNIYNPKEVKIIIPLLSNTIKTFQDYNHLEINLKKFNKHDEVVRKSLELSRINLQWLKLRSNEFNIEISTSI